MTYSSGLRLRAPEPMPECADGETPQHYYARILSQTSIESATSAENTTGDSSPTPFNLGQIQQDIGDLKEDVDELESDVATLQTQVATNTSTIASFQDLAGSIASNMEELVAGTTNITIAFPTPGLWDVVATAGAADKLLELHVTFINQTQFTLSWKTACVAGATVYWIAIRRS
jgi:hypothetical protein